MSRFQCRCFRFRFTALDAIFFPPGKAGNVVRGAFGLALRDTAPTDVYRSLFEPRRTGSAGPSGLSDAPRPFVFRLDSADSIPAGGRWSLGLNLFATAPVLLPHFESALAKMAESGLGPARGRLRLDPDIESSLVSIDLGVPGPEAASIEIEFRTPTELKAAGEVVDSPAFPTLFARLRDRVATLTALYGAAPLNVDFRGLGARSAAVQIVRQDTASHRVQRISSRTGQTHPIGGFTGVVMYAGELAEFLPWLRAGECAGVGRQTSWGKGEIRVRRVVSQIVSREL